MNNGTGQSEQTETMSRETLFPEGWDKTQEPEQPDMLAEESEGESEDLAEAQEELGEETAETPDDAVASTMPLNRFLKAAGWELNEAYHNLMVKKKDGTEVTLSKALDEQGELSTAYDALLKERQALQERLDQSAAQVPTQGISPEAQALMSQAQIYHQALQTTDWSQMDPGAAANQKLDLQMEIQRLQGQAQAKQVEYQTEWQDKLTKAKAEAERQTRARIPEWSDSTIMQSDRRAIGDMLYGYGMTAQEVESIVDPRVWQMLRDAQKAMANGRKIAEGAKRVRKVGKTLGAGARSGPSKKTKSAEQLKAEFKEAEKKGGKAALQAARLAAEFDISPR